MQASATYNLQWKEKHYNIITKYLTMFSEYSYRALQNPASNNRETFLNTPQLL
jgi:hypothetical protein